MGNVLLYSTRGLTSKFVTSLIQQFLVSETLGVCDIMLNQKTTKVSKYIMDVSGLQINEVVMPYHEFYHTKVFKMSDWVEAYNSIDLTPLAKYKKLVIFGGILSEKSYLQYGSKRLMKFPEDRGQINFLSVGSTIFHVLAMLKANRELGIPLYEVIYDPQEVSLNAINLKYRPIDNYKLFHGYTDESRSFERLDSMQYFLEMYQDQNIFGAPKKDIDFTFGMTALTQVRSKQIEKAKEAARHFKNAKLFLHDKFSDEPSSFIGREQYLQLIGRSRYTLVVPAYDATQFSIYRLIESLHAGCLPLLHDDVICENVEKSFGINLSSLYLKNFDFGTTESRRLEIVDDLRSKVCEYRKGF